MNPPTPLDRGASLNRSFAWNDHKPPNPPYQGGFSWAGTPHDRGGFLWILQPRAKCAEGLPERSLKTGLAKEGISFYWPMACFNAFWL